MKKSLLLAALCLNACTDSSKTVTTTATAGLEDADVTIDELTYDAAAHSLTLKMSSVKCKEMVFKLSFGACAESYPAQCSAELQNETPIKICTTPTESVSFVHKLDAGFDASYVSVINKAKASKSVLVDKTGNVAKSVMPPTDSGNAVPPANAETEQSAAIISNPKYDKDKHAVTMTLEYGGCENAKHSLKFSEFCAQSYPMQCGAVLVWEKNYNATCKKRIVEDFSYTLQNNFDTSVLTINAKASNAKVLVDRLGRVPATP